MNSQNQLLDNFSQLIEQRYNELSQLFLELPFSNVESIGQSLLCLSRECKDQLEEGVYPKEIIEQYLNQRLGIESSEEQIDALFKVVQFVERKVALFDAIEDSAFRYVRDFQGEGTLAHLLGKIKSNQKEHVLLESLRNYKARIVLTAHPTQFYPQTILWAINDLTEAIKSNDIQSVKELLLQMGKTSFESKSRPTPVEEAQSLIWYLENVLYEAFSSLQIQLGEFLNTDTTLAPSVEIGFWPGGDRDGNPYVTAEVTLQVAKLLRQSILKLYLQEILYLKRRLTFQGVSESIESIEENLSYQVSLPIDSPKHEYLKYQVSDFLSDLNNIKDILIQKHDRLFLSKVNSVIVKAQIFGFHFASMDIREDSSVHSKAVDELETQNPAVITQLSAETVNSLKVIKEIQDINGLSAIKSYIISNTQSLDNVLNVVRIAEIAELDQVNFNIVPLFETVQDLTNAPQVMKQLYENSQYRKILQAKGNKQIIMMGFSDGTKDGGYLAANWSIYKAKQALSQMSRKYGIQVVFFDGRGGPPARGGGETRDFYRSFGPEIDHHEIHLTIQGQTISSSFGTVDSACFNLEQLFTAGLENKIFPNESTRITSSQEQLIDKLARVALESYTDLRGHSLFTRYLEEVTPLLLYQKLNIASRPTKRHSASKSLSLKDLRAIPFVGAWTHMKQNVPGFYGLGTAIKSLSQSGHMEDIQQLYKDNLFFQTLLNNAMQSLMKAYFPLTQYLAQDGQFSEFWDILHSEANLSKEYLQLISREVDLLSHCPINQASIRIRESIVLPLLTIQHYAIQKIQENSGSMNNIQLDDQIYEKLILKSLPATVNASRNSV